jgi:hypothetical protein
LAFLLAAAAVLWWRRLAGAFSAPLEPAALLLAAASVAALVAFTRIAWRYQASERRSRLPARLAPVALSTAAVGVGAALWLPQTSLSGLLILCAVLALEEGWAWGLAGKWRRRIRKQPRSPTLDEELRLDATSAAPGAILPGLQLEHPPDGMVTQQITRVQSSEGSEVLSGWLRVRMAAGQRSANVHVAFCPQFARAPRVSVEQRGGPSARIKTVQVLPQGVRFDLKLAAPGAEAQTVLLAFSAESAPRVEPARPDGQSSSGA